MKKKFLSILIASTIIVSQAPILQTSAITLEKSTSTYENGVNLQKDMMVDGSYQGEDGALVDNIKTFKTVEAAINAIPTENTKNVVIFIKNGTYKEKLKISKPNVTLVGESSEGAVITFDDASGTIKRTEDGGDGTLTYGTSNSASVTVTEAASNFAAVNLTIANEFDEEANASMKNKQAIALKNESNKSMLVNCRLLGNQDTLYANKNNQYYYGCYIEGDVDFIFGGANAVFDNCEIKSIDRVGIDPKGYVAAPSTLEENKGFLIQNSKLTSNIEEKESIYLGRPWHPSSAKTPVNSTVIYKNCEIGAHIKTEGWTEMSCAGVMIQPLDNRMYEYGSTGEGSRTSNTRRVLTDEQASQYTIENILSGWDVSQKKAELELYKKM